MSRLVEKVKDQDVVWQGFASCTSFAILLKDKLDLYEKYSKEEANIYKCALLSIEISNLVSTFIEQVISWIIAIDKWYKDRSKTLLYYLCSVGSGEINSFLDKYVPSYKTKRSDFLQPYIYDLNGETKDKIYKEIDFCFELLFSTTFMNALNDLQMENSKKLLYGIKQIHNKTRHGYILLESNKLKSLFVPEGYAANEIKVLDKDTSEVLPIVVANKLGILKSYLCLVLQTTNIFQIIIGTYSLNRFKDESKVQEKELDIIKASFGGSAPKFIADMQEAMKDFSSLVT